MPKLDLEPAKSPDYLDGFIKYLKHKREIRPDSEREKYSMMILDVEIEQLASLYIYNAWQKVKLSKLRDLPTGETDE